MEIIEQIKKIRLVFFLLFLLVVFVGKDADWSLDALFLILMVFIGQTIWFAKKHKIFFLKSGVIMRGEGVSRFGNVMLMIWIPLFVIYLLYRLF